MATVSESWRKDVHHLGPRVAFAISTTSSLISDRHRAILAPAFYAQMPANWRGQNSIGDWANVRWIVAIVFLLGDAGWLACQFETSASSAGDHVVTTQWRHMAYGWERVITLSPPKQPWHASNDFWAFQPHPIILALFEGMLSVLVLVAFSPTVDFPSSIQRTIQERPGQEKRIANLSEVKLRSRYWLNKSGNS